MISIIISSSNKAYLKAVKKNIDETIGVPYEILAVDNAEGKKGICEVYNTAGAQARYDVMCFMHEDIILHTQDWGKKVIEIMRDPKIGLLGIAGSTYKSISPAGWACPGMEKSRFKTNIIQRFKFMKHKTTHYLENSKNEKLARVVTIDGVWMCTKKSVFEDFPFDSQLFKRFHGYDVDLSLQIGNKYQVCVTYEVLIEHFSEGNFSEEWLRDIFLLHEKQNEKLPITIDLIPLKERRHGEKIACKLLMRQLKEYNYSTSQRLNILSKYNLKKGLGLKLFILFHLNILINRY